MTTLATPSAAAHPARSQPRPAAPPTEPLLAAASPATAPRPTVILLAIDPAARAVRAAALGAAGLRVVAVGTIEAVRAALGIGATCLVLDRRAPDGDALVLVDELYCTEGAPRMVVVTGQESERERIESLVAGADDVVPPHVSVTELVTRVRRLATPAVTERQRSRPVRLCVGRLTIDQDRREVRVDGDDVALSPTQYQILVSLAVEDGRAVTVRTLVERCWDRAQEQSSCAVRTQVTRLRRALRGAVEIRCVRGEGYRLAEAEG